MSIKKFYEMVSDDHIGTIQDILDDKILDDYNVNLVNLGVCKQIHFYKKHLSAGTPMSRYHFYEYQLPNGESLLFNESGHRESNRYNLFVIREKRAILIQLEIIDPEYLLENMEIIDLVKSSFETIKSMTNLEPVDFFLHGFKNGISIMYTHAPSNHLRVNWSKEDPDSIREFIETLAGKSLSVSKIQISMLFGIK